MRDRDHEQQAASADADAVRRAQGSARRGGHERALKHAEEAHSVDDIDPLNSAYIATPHLDEVSLDGHLHRPATRVPAR
jgi:hypothetical protein